MRKRAFLHLSNLSIISPANTVNYEITSRTKAFHATRAKISRFTKSRMKNSSITHHAEPLGGPLETKLSVLKASIFARTIYSRHFKGILSKFQAIGWWKEALMFSFESAIMLYFILCFRIGDRLPLLVSIFMTFVAFAVHWPVSNRYPTLGHYCKYDYSCLLSVTVP